MKLCPNDFPIFTGCAHHHFMPWRVARLQDLTKGTAGAQPTSPSSGVPSDEQALRERGSQVRWLKDVDRNLKKKESQKKNITLGKL